MSIPHRPHPDQKGAPKRLAALLPEKMPKPPGESKAVLVYITPEMAATWLKHNTANRPISPTDVLKLRRVIELGQYLVNGETVKFDCDHVLRDGQTRLRAVVESGKAIWSWTIFDLDSGCQVFETIDVNRKRSLGQMLAIRKVKNYNAVAAAINLIYSLDDSIATEPGGFTPNIGLTIFERRPELEEQASFIVGAGVRDLYAIGQAIGLFHMMTRKDLDAARNFWEVIGNGVVPNKRSPILIVRDTLNRNRDAGKEHKASPTKLAAVVIKGWNLIRAGKTCTRITWDPEREIFPQIQ